MTRETGHGAENFQIRDPEAFVRNMAQMFEHAGKAMAAYAGAKRDAAASPALAEETSDAVKTLAKVSESWLGRPERAIEAQSRLWRSYLDLWSFSMKRLAGEQAEPVALPDERDARFKDPDWSENPLFDIIKQAYLVTSRWAETMVDEADTLDPHTRHKASFYVKQIVNALAPSNFVLTNPELLRETLAENGENLARGMQLLAEDIVAGQGELRVRQSDSSKFEVGGNLATTPGKVVLRNELMELIQYESSTDKVLKRPLLIVPPWINKFYILDLTPEKSLIRWMVDQGHTVFVISWINPDMHLAQKSFEDYMRDGILTAVDAVTKATRHDRVNTVGYCVGGTLLGVTLAYSAAQKDKRIASATLMTAQVDFTHAGDLKVFVDEEQIQALEKRMKKRGYLEGKKMAAAFNMLRSNDLIWPYFINNYMRGRDPFPFDLLYWNSDSTRMPAANHAFYLRHCYLQNDLARGQMEIAGEVLDVSKVTVPIYNLATREDHIAPAKSVFLGSGSFGGPVRFVLAGSGHIAGVVNPPARKKYQYWTGGDPVGSLEAWLAEAEEHPGSWWPDWQAWIEAQDDARVKARKVGGPGLKVLADAPGDYVRARD